MANKERYFEDSRAAFCHAVGVDVTELMPLLDWINAPANLQQFLAVVPNLIAILAVARESAFFC